MNHRCSGQYCYTNVKVAGTTCKECRDASRDAAAMVPVIESFVESVEAPEGFVKTVGKGFNNGFETFSDAHVSKETYVLFVNETIGVKISLCLSAMPAVRYKAGKKVVPRKRTLVDVTGSGHTCYKDAQGVWRTFDRRGIEDSFYLGDFGEKLEDVAVVFAAQLKRVEDARERSKKMLSIPGFGFSVHEDNLEAMKKRLQSGLSQSFLPAGFGTGHIVSTKRSRDSRPLPAVTAAFFGVSQLFDSTFDHD